MEVVFFFRVTMDVLIVCTEGHGVPNELQFIKKGIFQSKHSITRLCNPRTNLATTQLSFLSFLPLLA